MESEDVEKAKKKRRSCCNKWICNTIVLAAVVIFIVVICVVTLVDKNVRKVDKYDPSKLKWWQKTIIYQIYPRSFQDSDGDGVGDLKGIINRLDHFKYLGIGAVWISPFYLSPMKDFGYDVQNFTDVDPLFGNMTDFDELMKKAAEKDIKIIMDFVPNHTSNESNWFVNSKDSDPKYKDYYIWVNATGNGHDSCTQQSSPPNQWMSVFGGSAWEWDESRGQFYYHAFLKEQPDLNYRNSEVIKQMQSAMRFWCKKGVAGFRLDAIKNLFEVTDLSSDEVGSLPLYVQGSCELNPYNDSPHNLTTNLPGVFDVIKGWRTVLDECEKGDKTPRFMVGESYGLSAELKTKYFEAGAVPFDFGLIEKANKDCGGNCIKNIIMDSLKSLPTDAWPSFVLGNHDNSRVADRFGKEMVNALNMLLLTLPGTPTTYYGEEIGMEDVNYSFTETQDPAGINYGQKGYRNHSRDPERSPMQWSNTNYAGFSSNITWLRVGPDYHTTNVEDEKKNQSSTLNLYKSLSKLRQYGGFQTNHLEFATTNDDILSYTRYAAGWDKHMIILNLGRSTAEVDVSSSPVGSGSGQIVLTTNNFPDNKFRVGSDINLKEISLDRGQGLVIKVIH